MPASDFSEQISLAGTEASGTGNMKLMLNGAVTIGTLDGANIEIKDAAGDENIIIFGMKTEEVNARKFNYRPQDIYQHHGLIRCCVDRIANGINGCKFPEIAQSLRTQDPYMVLADFDSYRAAQAYAAQCYADRQRFAKMSLNNIAGAGVFSADRAVTEYAKNIWHL